MISNLLIITLFILWLAIAGVPSVRIYGYPSVIAEIVPDRTYGAILTNILQCSTKSAHVSLQCPTNVNSTQVIPCALNCSNSAYKASTVVFLFIAVNTLLLPLSAPMVIPSAPASLIRAYSSFGTSFCGLQIYCPLQIIFLSGLVKLYSLIFVKNSINGLNPPLTKLSVNLKFLIPIFSETAISSSAISMPVL